MPTRERFIFKGEGVEDTVLFYWSIVSISRALRFNAEAQHQKTVSYVLATVAGYYSLFHFGMFLLYSAPQMMHKRLRTKINNALKGGTQDPRHAVSHDAIGDFLKACQVHGLPSTTRALLKKARTLREFVNYGPDLRATSKGFRVFNRSHHPQELNDVLSRIDGVFLDSIEWASKVESDSRPLVPISLSMAKPFFVPSADGAPYYSEWSSSDVLSGAEALRSLLEDRSHTLVYPSRDA